MKNSAISVIIPALNEENYIGTLLESLKAQTFKDFEVIVVDGNSKDRTRDIAKKYAKVVVEKRPNMGLAKNTGAKLAKGEIIFFTDADSKLSKNLLKTYYELFKEKDVVAATGPLSPLEKTSPFLSFGFMFDTTTITNLTIRMGAPCNKCAKFCCAKIHIQAIRRL
jgi:glycosyltransferase involved in cell wall biosynthesis